MQSNDGDSFRKFPSKSCPLRYGTSKIKEDALSLFQAGLREYLGLFNVKISGNQNNGWGITGLSVTASKIVAIPSVSSKFLSAIIYYIHLLLYTYIQCFISICFLSGLQYKPLRCAPEYQMEANYNGFCLSFEDI